MIRKLFISLSIRFQLPNSRSILDRMTSEMSTYSKDLGKQKPFQPDSDTKQAAINPRVRDFVEEFAMRPYHTLERMRMMRHSATTELPKVLWT